MGGQKAQRDRGELFEDVADIYAHAPRNVRDLIEAETMAYDGSSKKSFRTTVSKKILEAYRKDRTFMKGFDWGGYLTIHKGAAPLVDGEPMLDSHSHHGSAPQKGRRREEEVVQRCQDLLWEEGIDPLFGLEQLGWASRSALGQHTFDEWVGNLKELTDLQTWKSDYNRFAAKAQEFCDIAAARKLDPATAQQFRQKRAERAAKKAARQKERDAKKSARQKPTLPAPLLQELKTSSSKPFQVITR